MKVYTVMMMIVSAALAVHAALLLCGQTGWLNSFDRAAYKDRRKYAKFLGKCILLLCAEMLASGLAALLIAPGISFILLAIAIIISFILFSKSSEKYYR